MKVRVPGRQLAAVARETPRASTSGRRYFVDYFFTHYYLFDLDTFYQNEMGDKEKKEGGGPRGKSPGFQRGRWRKSRGKQR